MEGKGAARQRLFAPMRTWHAAFHSRDPAQPRQSPEPAQSAARVLEKTLAQSGSSCCCRLVGVGFLPALAGALAAAGSWLLMLQKDLVVPFFAPVSRGALPCATTPQTAAPLLTAPRLLPQGQEARATSTCRCLCCCWLPLLLLASWPHAPPPPTPTNRLHLLHHHRRPGLQMRSRRLPR